MTGAETATTLYRVFRTDYNDRIDSSARDWLEGTTNGEVVAKPQD